MNDKTMVWVTFFKKREMRKIASPFFVSLFIIFIRLSKEDIIYVTFKMEKILNVNRASESVWFLVSAHLKWCNINYDCQ